MVKSLDIKRLKAKLGISRGLPLDLVFNYNSPVWDRRYFYPRDGLCRRFVELYNEPGSQILVFGKSLVGKTSLILYCLEVMLEKKICHIFCIEKMTTETFVRRALQKLEKTRSETISISKSSSWEAKATGSLYLVKGEGAVTQREHSEDRQTPWIETPEISDLAQSLSCHNVTLFVDDAEKISDVSLIDAFRNLGKHLSSGIEEGGKVVFAIANSRLEEISRIWKPCRSRIVPLKIPKMTIDEIKGLINRGCAFTYMKLESEVVNEITGMADGIPARAQLICLETGRDIARVAGIKDQRLTGNETKVDIDHFRNVIIEIIKDRHIYL